MNADPSLSQSDSSKVKTLYYDARTRKDSLAIIRITLYSDGLLLYDLNREGPHPPFRSTAGGEGGQRTDTYEGVATV